MKLSTVLAGKHFSFRDVKDVLAKANENKSGDTLADAENVTSRAPACRQKVGGVMQKPVTVQQYPDHENDHSADDRPIQRRHPLIYIYFHSRGQQRIHFSPLLKNITVI